MIQCPKCFSPRTKSYGNSRSIAADGILYRYMQCRTCHTKWRRQESRYFCDLPEFPRPAPGEPVFLAKRRLEKSGFWITVIPDPRPNLIIQNTALPPGDYVAVAPLAPGESYQYVPHFGYACAVRREGFAPVDKLLRAGPTPLAFGISLAAFWGNPIIVIGVSRLRKTAEWDDFLESVAPKDMEWIDP